MSEEQKSRAMAPNDSDLILKAKSGDMMAFEQLVYRYDKNVLSIAATYVNNAEDAKDIYQEVFLRVYRGLPRFELRSEFSTWLYRITTNVCLTHRSRRKRHAHASLQSEADGDEESHGVSEALIGGLQTDQYVLDSEISMHVEEAMERLSPRQKMVFTLRYYQGYKLREIAEMMACTEGTVKKYLFMATQKMRERLKDMYE